MIEKLFSGAVRIDTSNGQEAAMWSLTDMWKAAGGDSSKRPVIWLGNQGTEALIQVFRCQSQNSDFAREPVRTSRGGTNPGTWAATELAIAYAQFLSPEFHLRTIQEWKEWQMVRHSGGHAPGLTKDDVVSIVRAVVSETLRAQPPQLPAVVHSQSNIAPFELAMLKRDKRDLVEMGIRLRRWPNKRSGNATIQRELAEATGGWGSNGGTKLESMPVALLPVARRALAKLRIELERQDAILTKDAAPSGPTQGDLFKPALVRLDPANTGKKAGA